MSVSGHEVSIRVAHGRDLAPDLVADLSAAGTPVTRMEVVGPTLDDVFLDLTGRSFRESNETTETTQSDSTEITVSEGAAA